MNKKNKLFIKEELIKNAELFNNINGYQLDIMQKRAIITNEKSTLLIAGAGSGKTLTIVGKIRYLIEVLNVRESDILCISFTNDSVNSLKKSLEKVYKYNIDVFTFHKLALNILKENNENIRICEHGLLEYIIDEFFLCNLSGLEILKNKSEYNSFRTLIITFINLFKSNNYGREKFDEIFKSLKYGEDYVFLKIIYHIYLEYEIELSSKLEVDFNDMINKAINLVGKSNIKYKCIIIDEYQDTSFTKYQLVKCIQNCNNSNLFAVGDDFQSIYRFTGCDLNIFLKFKEYFNYSNVMKIENTYRNSKELIDVAGSFIMKNKSQIQKRLKSNKRLSRPIKIIYYNKKVNLLENIIIKIYEKSKDPIIILGRNNNDIYEFIGEDFCLYDDGTLIYNKNKNIKLRYLTVHKSKGLEEENVILINLEDSITGFPSKVINEKILNYVLTKKDHYKYEEERRLFYVALTRTKNNVYLLVNKHSVSIFVRELIKDYKFSIQIINKLL